MRYLNLFLYLVIISSLCSFKPDTVADKIKAIDNEAAAIDSHLQAYRSVHRKCIDCFGTNVYYKDSITIVKANNYQSCFDINYYYRDKRLILVTIDGSFKRTCGYSVANYCWDSTVVRDYRARIYYDKKKILKEIETGSKPCCEIRPCGGEGTPDIDFSKKAKAFLELYGTVTETFELSHFRFN